MKHVDVLVVRETKLDNSLPTSQFLVKDFSKTFSPDQNRDGGGLMIYIRDDIPSRPLWRHVLPSDIEGIFIELDIGKWKWLVLRTYHSPSHSHQHYFNNLDKSLDT